ncbi:hypothetical protein JTB14_035932 [Gonioctena quinquepunctata]|nr:hypothetical protein JTB14_035932 [Gonioctena quinquepunctata]
MERNHLRLAPHKTDAVILKGPRDREGIQFTTGDATVTPQRHIKYSGIWIDDKLNFKVHIRKVTKKAYCHTIEDHAQNRWSYVR